MPYVAWVTRRFMEETYNGHDYETDSTERFEAETDDELLNQIARHVHYYEMHKPSEHKGFEFSNIYHTGQGGVVSMDMLRKTDEWKKLTAKYEEMELHRKAVADAMLERSKQHQDNLEKAEYERLKKKFEPSTTE